MALKKRVSKACDTCRKSKTKCDGERPCQRCLSENKICTYSDWSIGYSEGKLKRLYNQEYVDLLETRVSLLTKSLGLLFLEFDRCLDSGVVTIDASRIEKYRQMQYDALMLRQGIVPTPANVDGSTVSGGISESTSDAAEVWARLYRNRRMFINPTTRKLNINQVVYSIIPTNVDMATKSVNFTACSEAEMQDLRTIVGKSKMGPDDISPEVADRYLGHGYVTKDNLFTLDCSQDGIPLNVTSQPSMLRKRRKSFGPENGNSELVFQKPASNPPQSNLSLNKLSSETNWYDNFQDDPQSMPHPDQAQAATVTAFYRDFHSTTPEMNASNEENMAHYQQDSLENVHIGIKPINKSPV
ncbi:LAMI_0B03180g1_1 [Lachancea mirantina]|uniref:LAMI_0B03180g1_1 n=1 Tax=Lachancea mirantina TaxID=1230905 RepID=A0A1G4IUB7_9SACH|nr:LAMI_0B03180g1_1 [Lachancea mirantina]